MKLSAVIICKNESSCIERMLKSIEWVDQICILDTWSTDNTMEICRRYTDEVYQDSSFYKRTPWVDWVFNFWWARNKALSYATWKWIISIDCDEVLEEWWIEKVRK